MNKKEFYQRAYSERTGCGGPLYFAGIILFVCFLYGCKSVNNVERNTDSHNVSELMNRIDSLMYSTSTWQQSIYEKQTKLEESFHQSEVRDTSRTIFLGAAGDTIREKTIIYVERNSEQKSSEKTTEYWEEKFRQTDSLLQIAIEHQEKTDSLLKDHQKVTVIEKKESWTDRALKNIGWITTVALIIIILLLKFYGGRKKTS